MSALPKYAIDVMGVQVHTGKEPSHTSDGTLFFKDQTSCLPGTRDNLGNDDVIFVEPASQAYLTPQTARSVTFIAYDSNGSMTIVSGDEFNVKVGDPRGNRGITIGDNTVQYNTFD